MKSLHSQELRYSSDFTSQARVRAGAVTVHTPLTFQVSGDRAAHLERGDGQSPPCVVESGRSGAPRSCVGKMPP